MVLLTAYSRIQPLQRCSFKMAGYSAVKPAVFHLAKMKVFLDVQADHFDGLDVKET